MVARVAMAEPLETEKKDRLLRLTAKMVPAPEATAAPLARAAEAASVGKAATADHWSISATVTVLNN